MTNLHATPLFRRPASLFILGLISTVAIGSNAYAQPAQRSSPESTNQATDQAAGQTSPQSSGRQTMELTPGQPLVTLTLEAPAEIRLGRSFNYAIHVQNNSQNVMLHNVVILQHAADAFEIESTKLEDAATTANAPTTNPDATSAQTTNTQTRNTQTPNAQTPNTQTDNTQTDNTQAGNTQAGSTQAGSTQADGGQAADDGTRWRIDRLAPGQSKTIRVAASSDAEGTGNVCVAIESYSPALCLSTRFVKPELEIAKQAPAAADICQEIPFEYVITNTGSGDLESFTVTDDLPDGLATIDGQQRLAFALEDGLKAGATRKFVARLRAERTGEYFSRAIVEGPDGVSARSNRAGTNVVQPQLAIDIAGPQALEAGSLANYRIRVTNQGDAPAPSTRLAVYFPRSADILRAGQPRPTNQAVDTQATNPQPQAAGGNSTYNQAAGGQPADAQPADAQPTDTQTGNTQSGNTPAGNAPTDNVPTGNTQAPTTAQVTGGASTDGGNTGNGPANSTDPNSRQQMGSGSWDLGTIEPGQTVEVSYVLRPYQGGAIEQQAVAQYVCAHDQAAAQATVEDRITTQVLALSGLRLTVIDDQDPVPAGEQVTYTITVLNQGNATARNVQVAATLPEGLQFVSASGQSNGQNAENEVTFEPIPTLDAKAEVSWTVVASVAGTVATKDQQSIKVRLDSDDLDETIESEEPTTLFKVQ